MAIIQAVLSALTASLKNILNTAFGWATLMLFGRVPSNKQIYLSVMTFGAVAWLIALLGVVFPWFATWLLTLVKLPSWVGKDLIRLVMLAAVIVIPLVVGFVATKIAPAEGQPQRSTLSTILKGYPYTLGLAITLVMMMIFAPVLQIRTILRRWQTEHMPVLIRATDYLDVVGEIQRNLESMGWNARRRKASWLLRFPTRILTALAGGAVKSFVAKNLTTLVATNLELIVHPSDLIISGKSEDVVHARAVLAERLAFSKAHLTWSEDGNCLEDEIRALWREVSQAPDVPAGAAAQGELARLRSIVTELRRAKVPYDEWEVIEREKLLVERALLEQLAGLTPSSRDLAAIAPAETIAEPEPAEETMRRSIISGVAAAIVAAVLVVARLFRPGQPAA